MKLKFFILSVLLVSSVSSFSQTERGKLVIGGNSGLSYNSFFADGESISTISLNAGLGYFIVDNLAVGINGNLVNLNTDFGNGTIYGIIPSATYFFGKSQLKPFLSVGLGYMNFYKEGVLAYGGIGGLAYMIKENLSFNVSLQYLRLSKDGQGLNNLATGLGFSIYF